jgi:hypothetical protein
MNFRIHAAGFNKIPQAVFSWYGIYGKNRPEIAWIKACMQVLDKCSDIKKMTFDKLKQSDGYWLCTYAVKTLRSGEQAMISVKFTLYSNDVQIQSKGPQSFVDLK